MIRLLLVDDNLEARQVIARDLSAGGTIQVLAEAETSDQAWKVAEKLLPDIVLLDVHLPGLMPTIDLVRRLSTLRRVKVVMNAHKGKAAEVQDFLDAGASGYVLKSDQPALIRMAILMVSRGSKDVISPSLPRYVTHLSVQERSILRQITKRGGLSKAAVQLGIPQETLDQALGALLEKLELSDTTQIVKWAKKHGF